MTEARYYCSNCRANHTYERGPDEGFPERQECPNCEDMERLVGDVIYTREELQAHRKIWVNALRSGKYEQGKHALRLYDGSFCCLGVACEVSGLGEWRFALGETIGYITHDSTDADLTTNALLPPAVQQWLGLSTDGGDWSGGALYTMNDDDGKSFNEIADLIESAPNGLFID